MEWSGVVEAMGDKADGRITSQRPHALVSPTELAASSTPHGALCPPPTHNSCPQPLDPVNRKNDTG